jgi:broad specificity phosphatase PhoE
LWLIRHAEVEIRYQNVFGGIIDMDLSDRGRQQAAALAGYLRRQPLDAVYASPMRRVQQTLAPLMNNGTPAPIVLPGLREADFGDWTGLSWAEVQARHGVSAFSWLEQLERGGIPNAETVPALRARVEDCLRQIIAANAGRQVAVFCHGGVIRVALAILLDWPLAPFAAFEIDYTSVSRVIVSPDDAQVSLLNFTPWSDLPDAEHGTRRER